MKSNRNGDIVQIKMDKGEIKINFSFMKTLNNDIGLSTSVRTFSSYLFIINLLLSKKNFMSLWIEFTEVGFINLNGL